MIADIRADIERNEFVHILEETAHPSKGGAKIVVLVTALDINHMTDVIVRKYRHLRVAGDVMRTRKPVQLPIGDEAGNFGKPLAGRTKAMEDFTHIQSNLVGSPIGSLPVSVIYAGAIAPLIKSSGCASGAKPFRQRSRN